MKKIVSVILTLIMLFSMCSIAAFAEDEKLIITVANDLHYNTVETALAHKGNSVNEDFAHIGTSTRLPHEAKAILVAFLEEAAKNESQYVLVPGDLTDGRIHEAALVVAQMLRDFEAQTGKQVYVVPGNHDLDGSTVEEFKADFAEFGYDEAIEIDADSGSYVADLNDDYRLIAIDSCVEGDGRHGIDEARLQWIAKQGEKARQDGKKLIGMHHHNLLEHMILSGVFQPNGVVSAKVENAPEIYAQAGIKYVFTGHTHDHDIASYTAADGTVIYDVLTSSLNAYGSFYRVVTFGEDVKIETRSVDKIDVSLLPEGISDNALALAESDFTEYQRVATYLSYYLIFNHYTKADTLKSLLKVEDDEMNVILDKVGNRLNEALNMPFNKVDEVESGKSIESLVEKYNTTIPETDYDNMLELAVSIYQAHNNGDENYPPYSEEIIVFTRGLAAVINYALSEVSADEYARVLAFVAQLLGVNIPINLLAYAGDGIKRFEGIEILVTTVALPLISDFATDDAPGDCNVTLPGYTELVEENNETFWDKIVSFFKMIFDAFLTIFAFLPDGI